MDVTCSTYENDTQVRVYGDLSWYPFFEPDPTQVDVIFAGNTQTAARDSTGYGTASYTTTFDDSQASGQVVITVRVYTDLDRVAYTDYPFTMTVR